MLYSDAELLSAHTELCSAPAATGMFATLYDYAKLGSNVRRPAAPMQRQLCDHMLPCHLELSCRSAADAVPCLGCSLCTGKGLCAPAVCREASLAGGRASLRVRHNSS